MRLAFLFVASSVFGLAQTPHFDSVTITPSAPSADGQLHVQGLTDTAKGTLTYSNITLKELMSDAYEIREDQLRGPQWLATQRYDVSAQFPPHTPPDKVNLMLQALLAERFRMTTHPESQQSPVYDLVVAPGGPKLNSGADNSIVNADSTGTHWHVTVEGTVRHFANFLSRELDRPVLDKTGLTGSYKFAVDWDNANIPAALEQQLGLHLDPATGAVDILVIDDAKWWAAIPTDEAAFAAWVGILNQQDWPGYFCPEERYRYAERIGLSLAQVQGQTPAAALNALTPDQRAALESLATLLHEDPEHRQFPNEGPLCH